MVDLITPAIFLIFGSIALIVILGFALVLKSTSGPRLERDNYFSRRKERKPSNPQPSYSSRFDRQPSYRSASMGAVNLEGRKMLAIVIAIAIIGITISVFYQSFVGLLIIFSLPVIVNYLRSRSARTQPEREDSSS